MLSSLCWLAGQLASCSVPRCKAATHHRAPGAPCRLPVYIPFFVCLRAPHTSLQLSSVPICRLCSTSPSSSAGAAQGHGLRLRFPCACALPDYDKHALLCLRNSAWGVSCSPMEVLVTPAGTPSAAAEIWLMQSDRALPCGCCSNGGGAARAAGEPQRLWATRYDYWCGPGPGAGHRGSA